MCWMNPPPGSYASDVKTIETSGRLCGAGNTVVVIEHNMDVVKLADYVILIDMVRTGGTMGGESSLYRNPAGAGGIWTDHYGDYLRKC